MSDCRSARWAIPRSATSISAPGRSSSRTWRGSTARSLTAASTKTRRCSPPARGRAKARGGGCTCSAWSPTAASTRAGSTSRRSIELASPGGVPDVVFHAFTDGRDTAAARRARVPRRAGALAARSRADRHRQRPLLRDGPRHPLGADQARLRRDRPRPRASTRRAPPRRSRHSYERGETDEFCKPTVIGDYDGAGAGDVAIFVNFRPDRAREMTRALAEPNFDEFTRAGRSAARLDDDDLLPQGLALSGGLPRARGRRRPWRRRSPRPADASYTSPRPRSTPTSPTSSTADARGVEGEEQRFGDIAARRADLRPQARDERRREPLRPSSSHWRGGEYRFGSSTSQTPTWSATPG